MRIYFAIIGALIVFGVLWIALPSVYTNVDTTDAYSFLFLSPGIMNSTDNGLANVTIYDSTDLNEVRYSITPITFYANYTESNGVPIGTGNGACEVLGYDLSDAGGPILTGPFPMSFSGESWSVTTPIFYKGEHYFYVNCSSSTYGGDLLVQNDFTITNWEPLFNKSGAGVIEIDGSIVTVDRLSCFEDSLCTFNVSNRTHDPDLNDILTYTSIEGANTTLTDFTIDPVTGILDILVTHDDFTGNGSAFKKVELSVQDSSDARDTALLYVDVFAVNDAPEFLNLANQSFNRSELFNYTLLIADEEDNVPFFINISIASCVRAQWNPDPGCDLFEVGEYILNTTGYELDGEHFAGGMIEFNFIPDRDDVGEFVVNFTVTDSGNPNATRSELVTFTIINLNEAPFFTYVCDSVSSTTENAETTCYINATDIDEINNLTFFSDPVWFLPGVSIPVNVTTGFNGSAFVNFTPRDAQVGNWDINITVNDTGIPQLSNSTLYTLFIDNVDDPVYLYNLSAPLIAFTSNNYTIFLNASDDDLLIPDKTVYDEVLTFQTNATWLLVVGSELVAGTNRTVLELSFNPLDIPAPVTGMHTVNVSVSDASGNSASIDLRIDLSGNVAPFWIPGTATLHRSNEGEAIYYNYSLNVSDLDADILSFLPDGLLDFPGFSVGALTGVVNFTPSDADVGEHIFGINVSDGITPAKLMFNYTILNVNDVPSFIEPPFLLNATLGGPGINITVFEDSSAIISYFVHDEDLRIPPSQSGFYAESFILNLTLVGPNPSLFTFERDFTFPQPQFENVSHFEASFTPNKSDVGIYEGTFTVTDASGVEATTRFNLTVFEIEHPPVLANLTDQGTVPNVTLYYDIESYDLEDGDDDAGLLVYSYDFINGSDFILGDETIFNTTSGVLNFTPTQVHVGTYRLNITVTDTFGFEASDDFYLTVYQMPVILYPPLGFVFVMTEGEMDSWAFQVNASVTSDLLYAFYINNSFRTLFTGIGDGSTFFGNITPAYVDETYGRYTNVTLVAIIPGFVHLNATRTWNANISHANAPVQFIKQVPDMESGYGAPLLLDLKEHFSDPDYFDPIYAQNVTITILRNGTGGNTNSTISSSVDANWVVSFSASGVTSEIFNITITDLTGAGVPITSNTSNYFEVSFIPPIIIPQPVPVPSTGGGAGGSGSSPQKPQTLELITPGFVSINDANQVNVPLTISNKGSLAFNGITLGALLYVDGVVWPGAFIQFEVSEYPLLPPGRSEITSLLVDLTGVPAGAYEIEINGTVANPFLTDVARVVIAQQKSDSFTERLIFTEDLIVSNPECLELTELITDAEKFYAAGQIAEAEGKLSEAIEGCRDSLSQRSLFSRTRLRATLEDQVFRYLFITTLAAVLLGVIYYVYRRMEFIRIMRAQAVPDEDFDFMNIPS